jgi:hypothetical protein
VTFPLAQLFGPILAAAVIPPYNPITDIPNLIFLNSYKTIAPTGAVNANNATHPAFPGRRISGTAPAMSCNISSAGLTSAYAGGSAAFAGYTSPGNNGAFSLTNADAASISFNNPAGTLEPVAAVPTVATATVSVLGMASAYTDLVAGHAFSQATAGNRFAVNDTLVPGQRILGVEAAFTRWLECISAPLASQLDGTVALTGFMYFRPTAVNISGAGSNWMQFRDATNTNRIQFSYGAVTNGFISVATPAGTHSLTGVLSPAMQLNVWQLLAVTLVGTTARWYINGVQVATVTTGTARTRAGLDRTYVGGVTGTSGGTSGHYAVAGAVAREMTAAELLTLTAWCAAEYA